MSKFLPACDKKSSTLIRLKILSNILHTKTTAAQNGVALSYHKVHGLYFLEVVSVRSIVISVCGKNNLVIWRIVHLNLLLSTIDTSCV